jgi:hypothetical protein
MPKSLPFISLKILFINQPTTGDYIVWSTDIVSKGAQIICNIIEKYRKFIPEHYYAVNYCAAVQSCNAEHMYFTYVRFEEVR